LLLRVGAVQICSLLRGGIGERGGVRVGHRIIEINGHSMVAMPHERIVHLLATSVGEVPLILHHPMMLVFSWPVFFSGCRFSFVLTWVSILFMVFSTGFDFLSTTKGIGWEKWVTSLFGLVFC